VCSSSGAPTGGKTAGATSRKAALSQKATGKVAGVGGCTRHNFLRYRALVGLEVGMQLRSPNRMNAAITDEEAIGRVMRGETSSYEVLATRYHGRLHRLAQKFLHSEADAEDAVQGAHLLALRHIDQYAGRSSYLTWMSSITVNVALGQMRQRKGVVEAGEEQVGLLRSPMRDPEQQAIDRQMDGILAAALERLPPAYGKVFRLREMETLSTAETGERLGLTEACVKTRLVRARGLLRRRIQRTFKSAELPRYARIPESANPGTEPAERLVN
jgi:RNA polymerase sigma-70 factor (ECF subfamily)